MNEPTTAELSELDRQLGDIRLRLLSEREQRLRNLVLDLRRLAKTQPPEEASQARQDANDVEGLLVYCAGLKAFAEELDAMLNLNALDEERRAGARRMLHLAEVS